MGVNLVPSSSTLVNAIRVNFHRITWRSERLPFRVVSSEVTPKYIRASVSLRFGWYERANSMRCNYAVVAQRWRSGGTAVVRC